MTDDIIRDDYYLFPCAAGDFHPVTQTDMTDLTLLTGGM